MKQNNTNMGRAGIFSKAQWITDKSVVTSKDRSPVPMTFYKHLKLKEKPENVMLYATAFGNYICRINGSRIGRDVLAPGYTSYSHRLQYQQYDVTELFQEENDILFVVSGGWAVGFYGFIGTTKAAAKRQLLLAELHIRYGDGSEDVIGTDSAFGVCSSGAYKTAGIYEGVSFDARIDEIALDYKAADIGRAKYSPKLIPSNGTLATFAEELYPIAHHMSARGGLIYDFGQNFSGVVRLKIKNAKAGQKITVKHAEVLVDGEIFTSNLRKARAELEYICHEGKQEYTAELTTMGFRYIRVQGAKPEDYDVSAFVVSSINDITGRFSCSNELLNSLQRNIVWGGRSNFVDIPTDCPQRDERMGWTGDIAVFARTACANFDMKEFLGKWLEDVRLEQGFGGGIPMVVPKGKNPVPVFAIAGWSDCASMVPWALYCATGDKAILSQSYNSMKRLCKAESFWSNFFRFGKYRYTWKGLFQFGDWCAPGESAKIWRKKGTWLGTAYHYHTCDILRKSAVILGLPEDEKKYDILCRKAADAYRRAFTDGHGKLNYEFTSGYVCPIYFGMVDGEEKQAMGDNLVRLVRDNGYRLSTGFLGTPYILFALADTGHIEDAYRVLLQEECPGWMYTVKAGGTTIWEKWDALKPDGSINLAAGDGEDQTSSKEFDPEDQSAPSMTSFNHYAYGAVGDFFYRRIAGIEAMSGGYRSYRIRPLPGGDLSWVEAEVMTANGSLKSRWEISDDLFKIKITSPEDSDGILIMPDGSMEKLNVGENNFSCKYRRENRKND